MLIEKKSLLCLKLITTDFTDSKGARPAPATDKQIKRIDFGTLDRHQAGGKAIQNIGGGQGINVFDGNVNIQGNVYIIGQSASGMLSY